MVKKSVGKVSVENSNTKILASVIVLLVVASVAVILSNSGGDEAFNGITGYTITGWSGFGGGGGGCNERNVCNAYGDVVKYCAKTLVADCQYGCTSGSCNPAPEPTTFCGDGICNGGETLTTCSQDCSEEETSLKTVCETSSILSIQCCQDNSAAGTQRRSNCCDYVCANRGYACTQTEIENCNYFDG